MTKHFKPDRTFHYRILVRSISERTAVPYSGLPTSLSQLKNVIIKFSNQEKITDTQNGGLVAKYIVFLLSLALSRSLSLLSPSHPEEV